MAIGVFHTSNYYFLLDENQTPIDMHDRREFVEEELDNRLIQTGKLPNLGSAPIASWLVARLAALTGGNLGLINGEEQGVDGGDCCLELLVFGSNQKPVGSMQLQAGQGIAVLGSCGGSENPELIMQEFVEALLAKPSDVGEFSIRVRDPETGSRRVYGYDGSKYLGRSKR